MAQAANTGRGVLSPFHRALAGFVISVTAAIAQTPPDEILLKDYKPRSIFKIPETGIEKARYPYFRKYHWPMHAFALPDEVLKKVYRENASKFLRAN